MLPWIGHRHSSTTLTVFGRPSCLHIRERRRTQYTPSLLTPNSPLTFKAAALYVYLFSAYESHWTDYTSQQELYGLYADAAYNVSLDGQSPVQMQGKNSSFEISRMWDQNTLLYMVDGLADDLNHTVTVSTLSGTNNNRSFFFDHAVVRSTQG